MPQIPFLDRVLQLPVFVLQRRVRGVQTVQKPEIPQCSSSTLSTCPLLCVDRCRRWSRQCRKHREDSARVFWTRFMPSLCNDRCRKVVTVQKTVESPWLVLLLDQVVDVPVLATSWVCRGSAVAVSAHHGYDDLMRRLFRAVYTSTRPGLTPAILAEKGWRGRRELAPRRSATRIGCICCVAWTDTSHIHKVPNHNHHNHHDRHTSSC